MGVSARQERREQLAALQAAQRKAEQRRVRIIVAAAIGVAVALVVPTVLVVVNAEREQRAVRAAAEAPIEGVEEFSGLDATHTTEDVAYAQTPPVGGDHHPVWQNCGFYDAPIIEEHGVHSLEHGAVWLAYGPDLPGDDVAELRRLADKHPYLLVSPRDDVDGLVASAWGVQLRLDGVGDDRLEPFLVKYLQGPQTPEPGAACTGGVGA